MNVTLKRTIWLLSIALPALLSQARPAAAGGQPVQFSRAILPILSQNCFQCHGPDEKARKAKLRLDTQDGARKVIIPGRSADSELVRRISAEDPEERMPPLKTGRKLSALQKELLAQWIDQGAAWGKHWAYETPVRPALPAVKNTAWPRNAIDYFVLSRLEKEDLPPAQEAPKTTLIRRVTLDLTGLPPTTREVDDFLADHSPAAYEKLVDRLLSSERYGERMAMDWLDDARFADTNGYQNDFARTMWPWRDWVIAAYNRNLPFDRFVIEQIAGDLLPGATLEQRIASGFNRNNRTVTEAGSIDEEWRVENAVDRVETTATVFLGLTLGCARCHDHKYDPISQREFYEFFGFFNSVNEKGVYTEQPGNVPPLVAVPSQQDELRLQELTAALATADKAVRDQEAALSQRQKEWEEQLNKDSESPEPHDWGVRLPLDGSLRFGMAGGKTGDAVYRKGANPVWTEGPFGKALRLDGQQEAFLEAARLSPQNVRSDFPTAAGSSRRAAALFSARWTMEQPIGALICSCRTKPSRFTWCIPGPATRSRSRPGRRCRGTYGPTSLSPTTARVKRPASGSTSTAARPSWR
jgi:mono/diheme cytochrome c family protein